MKAMVVIQDKLRTTTRRCGIDVYLASTQVYQDICFPAPELSTALVLTHALSPAFCWIIIETSADFTETGSGQH